MFFKPTPANSHIINNSGKISWGKLNEKSSILILSSKAVFPYFFFDLLKNTFPVSNNISQIFDLDSGAGSQNIFILPIAIFCYP